MAKNRFLIAPFTSGIEDNVEPWLLPENAFEDLRNMYVFRGRVRKRFGGVLTSDDSTAVDVGTAQLSSRLRINLGTTDGNGDLSGTVPGLKFKIGQLFSVGTEIFTVDTLGNPGTMLTTGSATTHTYDTTTGAYVIAGAAATKAVFFYPAEPVMGITQFETLVVNDEPTFCFDTQFAYQFSGNGWLRLGTKTWVGSNSDFYWATNWHGVEAFDLVLFVTNFVAADGIQWWDPNPTVPPALWNTLNPVLNAAGDTLETARILIPFKGRLLAFNTIEKAGGVDNQFGSRCRFSINGDPTKNATSWLQATSEGSFIDASTQEQIITATFLKDRLIVFFERSTWELVYTGNDVQPFRWQRINSELGAESTFSIVPFDKVAVGVGNVGVHACNGANVERIDDKIPDLVFNIHNENEGVKRVYGIRDFTNEMIYWAFPSDTTNDTFPTRVLVYNYKNKSWAIFDDSITAFGYFQNETNLTWESTEQTWEESSFAWNSGVLQSEFRQVLAGNQEGFVFIAAPDIQRNSPALQITGIVTATSTLTIIDHNLHQGDYIAVENLQGTTADTNIYKVASVATDTIVLLGATLTGTYTGGGTVARVSNPQITSKQYNFYVQDGRNVEVTNTDFYLDKTVNGEFSIDYFASSSNAVLGTVIVETRPYSETFAPLEQSQERIWHRAYLDAEGDNFQIKTYLSFDQMTDSSIAWSDLTIHAIMFSARPTRSRLE